MIPLLAQRSRLMTGGQAATGGTSCTAPAPGTLAAEWLRLARLARMLSWLTLGWLGIEAGAAIGAAVIAGSVALLAFGLDSGIEAMASIIVIWRFTGTRLASATSERYAQRLPVFSPGCSPTPCSAWWLDSIVALAISAWAVAEGHRAWAGQSCGGCACQPDPAALPITPSPHPR